MQSFDLTPIEVNFSIYLEDTVIQSSDASLPTFFILAQFQDIMNKVAQDPRAMRLSLSRKEQIWSQFENKMIEIPLSVDFYNKKFEEFAPDRFKEN